MGYQAIRLLDNHIRESHLHFLVEVPPGINTFNLSDGLLAEMGVEGTRTKCIETQQVKKCRELEEHSDRRRLAALERGGMEHHALDYVSYLEEKSKIRRGKHGINMHTWTASSAGSAL